MASLIAVLAAPAGAAAQTPLRASEEQVVNYAFATQLGSGVYDISGRTLQIYRLPFGYALAQPSGRRPGVRLTLPVTVGIVDFKPRDVLDTGLPETLDTVSFVPGIELDFELTPHWHLRPFAEAGQSRELSGDADATVYSLGAHAAALWSEERIDLRFRIGVTYSAVDPDAPLRSDDLLLLELGIEGRHALDVRLARHPLDWGVYVVSDTFADSPEEPLDRAAAEADPYQFEIGVTLGPRSRMTVWRIPVPRVGLGYRFGNDLGVWRLVFGAPF